MFEKNKEELFRIISEMKININDEKNRISSYKKLIGCIYKTMNKISKIYDLEIREALSLLYFAIYKYSPKDITVNHLNMIEQLIKKIFDNHSSILKHEVYKTLYRDENELFKKNSDHFEKNLYIVDDHLKCLKCGHKGAKQFYGRYYSKIRELSPAVGFGGTIPFECSNCGNQGLEGYPLEGYKVAFERIE